MLDLNGNPATSYDPDEKVWSGSSQQSLYNEELTVGQIIFRQLQRQPNRIFQISHTDNPVADAAKCSEDWLLSAGSRF